MPLIEDAEEILPIRKLQAQTEFEDLDPSLKDVALATFRTENIIGSAIAREKGLPDNSVTNPDFSPFDYFTEEESKDERFVGLAALADSEEEIEAVRRQRDRETEDRDTIAKGGALSYLLGFGVGGLLDPINLIPVGGTAYSTYRNGKSILTAGIATGSVAAGTTAAQEAGLHLTQIERTYGESAGNVSAALLLGGVLGAGIQSFKGVNSSKLIKEVESSMDPEAKIASGENSVGAAKVLEDVEIKGKFTRVLAKSLSFDPLTRTLSSDNPRTRSLANKLAENPYEVDGQVVTSIESLAKIHDGKYIAAQESHLNLYKQQRKTSRLNYKDFSEEVSREVRNPGASSIKEVQDSAKTWLSELYEPLKKELIDAGLLDESVDVKTAINYLNRVWNTRKITADIDGFVKKTSKWLKDEDVKLFEKARAAKEVIKTASKEEAEKLAETIKKSEAKQKLDLEDQDYESIAEDIAQRIRTSPDGILPYDFKIGEGSKKGGLKGSKNVRGPLKSRVFNAPDELMQDYLENDIELLGGRYLRQIAADLELHKAFDGDIEMTAAIKEVDDWWKGAIRKEKDPKKRVKMQNKAQRDRKDIEGMRDRIRGTFNRVDPDNPWVRIGRSIKDLNYLRFMGGVVASSIPDVARIATAEGFVNTFRFGLKPLIKNLKAFKVAAAEAKRYGVGSSAISKRSDILADISEYTQGGTAVERGLRSAAQSFGKINLMDAWTSSAKQLHAVTMQTAIIDGLLKGKIDKRLKRLGIDDDNAKAIAAHLKKNAENIEGVWISNAKNWDSPELEKLWGAAIRKESDRVIVMPGQEKPFFMSKEMGKTFFQFRSFMFSSTQRMLIAGLQGQDHNYIGGTLAGISLGMMAYAFKQWDAGREISDDPTTLILEGIDRSGSLGVLMEANNTLEKISGNQYGLRPGLGVTAPASRFASRSAAESLLGPTFGSFLTTSTRVLNAGIDGQEWQESDTRALRRLLPYQNLMIMRQGLDKIEEGANEWLTK